MKMIIIVKIFVESDKRRKIQVKTIVFNIKSDVHA